VNKHTMILKYVGLDVHKATVAVAVADAGGGEVRDVGTVAHELRTIGSVLQKFGPAAQTQVVYEAGPTGYGLYRWLIEHGYPAGVVAPSLIPRKAGDRVKTDRRDARMLARLARAGELTWITVPEAADEAIRDLTRAREDALAARQVARQQLQGFLLRLGLPYSGKTRWTHAHQRWLATLRLPHPVQQIVFTEYCQAVDRATAHLDRLTQALADALPDWRWYAVVRGLMSMRGLDVVAATMLAATVAEALHPDATVDSVCQAALTAAPESKLITFDKRTFASAHEYVETCLEIAAKYDDVLAAQKELYEKCLLYHMIDPLEVWGFSLAMFKIARGDVRQAAIGGTNIGRDSDTIAGRAAMLSGTLKGARTVPQDWLDLVPSHALERVRRNALRLTRLISDGKLARVRERASWHSLDGETSRPGDPSLL